MEDVDYSVKNRKSQVTNLNTVKFEDQGQLKTNSNILNNSKNITNEKLRKSSVAILRNRFFRSKCLKIKSLNTFTWNDEKNSTVQLLKRDYSKELLISTVTFLFHSFMLVCKCKILITVLLSTINLSNSWST